MDNFDEIKDAIRKITDEQLEVLIHYDFLFEPDTFFFIQKEMEKRGLTCGS